MSGSINKPFDRSYWVIPGKLLAGCYPGDRNDHEAERNLRGLLECGIRVVINLMEKHERDHYGRRFESYNSKLKKLAKDSANSTEIAHYPIQDLGVPSKSLMTDILNHIDGALLQDKPVYVHCWGGVGRTGTVVGCYLARRNIANGKDALDKIPELRFKWGDSTAHRNSPETKAQREMVCYWHESDPKL